ncbi:CBS domain-containing protein [Streptomyces montanus]|uniref:CBS domain-containing protein n=1 Tax=Streptomyces montanus TaxID=2580423 RepID=A0A5R9G531_9ACTN|nr:CBS domain-containing protein [Streptomyces montanus]TLS47883.1 CBS domain-containing protein [Streptomyces montanus]
MAQLVYDVMTPGATTVEPGASLVEVARLMRDQDLGGVLVAEGDRLLGVVTDRDIAMRVVADAGDPRIIDVGSICTPDPVCVGPDEEASAAVALMRRHAVRRLPVVQDGRPVGMVSLGDLAANRDPNSVLADISRAAPCPRRGPSAT